MFSKGLLRLFTPLIFLCIHLSILNAQPFWERDAGFDAGSTVRIGGGRAAESVSGLALLPDGKILASGRREGALSYILTRYHPNGQLDMSFGTNGKSGYQLGGYYGDAREILLLPDGKFILGASSEDALAIQAFSLVRFTPDGAVDSTFGTNGVAKNTSSPDLFDKLNAITLQPDGKILAAGSANFNSGPADQQSVTLQRFKANGSIDNSFGINGVVRLPCPDQYYEFNAVAVQADGRIVAAGSNADKIIVARFWPNGSPDNTFGTNGVRFLQYSAAGKTRCRGVAVLPDGKIVLGAWCYEYWYNNGAIAIRLLPDGSLDPTFHNGGMSFIHCSFQLNTSSMALQNDGKIVISAAGLNNDPMPATGIFRFLPDGAPDSSFAQNGAWVNPVGNHHSAFYTIKAMSDGKLLAGGTAKQFSDYDFTLFRLQNDGSPDGGFGNNGLVFTDFGWGSDRTSSLLIRPDGKALVGGNFNIGGVPAPENLCALAQMLPDGSPDPGFGNGGVDTFPGGTVEAVALQSDGKILVGVDNYFASNGHPVYLFRRLPNGGADSTFGQFGRVDSALGSFNSPALIQAGVLSNGKIIIAGSVTRPNTSRDFILTCLHPDGSRDISFGDNGFVVVDFNNKNDGVYGFVIQPDDKILLGGNGWSGNIAKKDVVVMRFHPDGSFDDSWGQNGVLFDDFQAPVNESISYMTCTPGGKLMLAVQCQLTADVADDALFENAVARYNADGSRDMAFGNSGKIIIPVNTPYAISRYIRQIRFLPNGKFVTAVSFPPASMQGDSFAIEMKRYLPDGTADTMPAAVLVVGDTWGPASGFRVMEMLPGEGIMWLAGSAQFDKRFNEDIVLARYRFNPGCFPISVQSTAGTWLDGAQVNISPSPDCPAMTILTGCDEDEVCLCGKDAAFIIPYKNDNPLNGVSTFDLLLISKHILGLNAFNSPYQLIAADANRSGTVTTFDIVEIRKLILGIYQIFPNNTSWRFIRKGYTFPNPANPFVPPFPEKDTVSALDPPARLAYRAVKTGDVNDSHVTGCDNFSGSASRQSLSLSITWCPAAAGSLLTVPVFFAEDADCAAWQCAFRFDHAALELVDVQMGELEGLSNDNFGLTGASNGVIRVLWYSENGNDRVIKAGKILFRLVFRAKKNIDPDEEAYLSTDEAALACRVYRANGDAAALSIDGRFQPCTQFNPVRVGLSPNPVGTSVCFTIENTEALKGELRICNAGGSLFLQQTVTWTNGLNCCLPEVAAWAPGLYTWRFIGDKGETAIGKFLKQ